MDLDSFKSLVDAVSTSSATASREDARALLARIRECFLPKDSNRARSDADGFIDDLGLRFMCEQVQAGPYLGIAQAIRQALAKPGTSTDTTSDWKRATEFASMYAANTTQQPAECAWNSNERVCCLSVAINELRKIGYQVELPESGGVVVSEPEAKKLIQDIEHQAASLGHVLALSISKTIANTYSTVTGRFNIGRIGQTIRTNAKPIRPFAYLYQLGLRYFGRSPSAFFPEERLTHLVNLATWATTLLDLSIGSFRLMFARHADLVEVMQKSTMYDSVFLLTQAKASHAREYIEWMMSHESLANLRDKHGRTPAQILAVATRLLQICENVCRNKAQDHFFPIDAQHIADHLRIDSKSATNLLLEVFTHNPGANQRLTFPPDDKEVDAPFRPLLAKNGELFMQPAPMAASAIVNASLRWCAENFPEKKFSVEAAGPLFENFVREKLAQCGVSVLHGDYKIGRSKGQCDAVISTGASVIFFELKSKMLRRQSRSGDDVATMVDLAEALVRPQAQAMERHAVLKEHGEIILKNEQSSETVTLGSREVIKLSITQGDLGSLHDAPFLRLFLQTGCAVEFVTVNPQRQGEFEPLHNWFRKFKSAAERADEAIFDTPTPFPTSWSLSVFHLLLILERTTDNESFSRELLRTRYMITPLRDFYAEYEFALSLFQSHEPKHFAQS